MHRYEMRIPALIILVVAHLGIVVDSKQKMNSRVNVTVKQMCTILG